MLEDDCLRLGEEHAMNEHYDLCWRSISMMSNILQILMLSDACGEFMCLSTVFTFIKT